MGLLYPEQQSMSLQELFLRKRRVPFARRLRGFFIENGVSLASQVGRLHPEVSHSKQGISCIRNVPYKATGLPDHTLDIFLPTKELKPGANKVVFYVHGGGFQFCSKDTHWILATLFAKQGYTVFNVNYRLAPRYRYPLAVEDVCDALLWVKQHANKYGACCDSLVLAGESAGANLVTSLACMASHRFPESWARKVFDADISIGGVIAACGILQVSNLERFGKRKKLPLPVLRVFVEMADYLPNHLSAQPSEWRFADPLLLLENIAKTKKPLPPFFAFAGTRDPILDDTRRLKSAIDRLNGTCHLHIYPDEIHVFHCFLWRKQARDCWQKQFEFLKSI